MPNENPFPKMTEFAKANPDSAVARALANYLAALAEATPKDKRYGIYQFINDGSGKEVVNDR